ASGLDQEVSRHKRRILLKELQGKSQCSETFDTTFGKRQRQAMSCKRAGWREESCMEWWRHVLPQAWQLSIGEVCAMSSRMYGDGTQGWVRHGAPSFGSSSAWASLVAPRSRTPRQSQRLGQYAHEPAALCQQRGSQEVRASVFPPAT